MGRKREDRQAKADHKKNRHLAKEAAENGEDDSVSLAHQLAPLGLQVREIPGDGNCLFRAVSDQLEGNSRNHTEYRVNTVTFMEHFRDDFEPFVEDDVPFDRHMANLRKSGTFAGNDALVALARYLKISIVIHQAGQPVWQINGCSDDSGKTRQIHLSYHNGEHYNSVRRVGDHSNSPSTIVCGKTVSPRPQTNAKAASEESSSGRSASVESEDASVNGNVESEYASVNASPLNDEEDVLINFVACETGLTDRSRIQRLLTDNNYDAAEVIGLVNGGGGCGGGGGTSSRVDCVGSSGDGEEKGDKDDDEKETESAKFQATKPKLSRPEAARSKVKSTKDKRKEKREVKKAKQAERNRRKLVGDDEDEDDIHVLTSEIQCLDL